MCKRTGVVNFLKDWGETWELFIVTRKALGLGNSKAEKEELKEEVFLHEHFVSYCSRVVRGARLGEFPTCQVRPNRLIAGTCHNIVSIF